MSTFATNLKQEPTAGPSLGFVGAIGIQRVTETLRGSFTVLRQLPGSESAEFYLARSTSGEPRLVRIKVLAPRAAHDARKREFFRLEARAAATLKHPSITRSSEALYIGGIHMSSIEHRPWSESLRNLLKRKGWLPLEQAARIVNQVASALDCAHSAGVLHLRLTPDNVLIEPNGHVMVTDFGIGAGAELTWAHKERSRAMLPKYSSVEQGMQHPLDHRSDIYSLGLLLYEILTDRVPFESCDSESLMEKRATQPPLPASLLSTGVPASISDIAMKLLERDANKRPARASGLQVALSRVMKTTIEVGKRG